MSKKKVLAVILGGAILAVPGAALPQAAKGGGNVTSTAGASGAVRAEQLITRYTPLAGSTANATSLVNGLRDQVLITLTGGSTPGTTPVGPYSPGGFTPGGPPAPSSVSFVPPTSPMGFGNVDIALALAEASLTEHKVSSATPQQLRAVLIGGSVPTPTSPSTSFPGILQLRAKDMGWGDIAKSLGFQLK